MTDSDFEGVDVVDSDERTIDIPDAPLGERLAAIQRQLDQADEVTTADVQAIHDQVQPVISELAAAMKPILESLQDAMKDMAEAFQSLQVATNDLDESHSDDSALPGDIQAARERRERQREQAEEELGGERYP